MKNRISLCNVILAATLLFMGCTLLEKKDTLSPSAPNPIPTSKAQKMEKPTGTYLITIKDGCNVRSKPNGKSKIMATLKKGQILQKIDQLENWYNIILPSGEKGWIHKDLVKNTFPVSNGALQTTTSESQKTTTQPQEKEHRTTENVWSAAMQGAGVANKISENTYSVIALASIWSENTANMYKQWDAAAKKACNGGAYKVIERQYVQGSGRENRQSKIIGTIECAK
jgi:SH3-like domain-containing protein